MPCGRVRCLRPSPTYIKIRYVPVRHKISTHMFKTRFISRYFIILCSRKCCRGIRRTASSSKALRRTRVTTLYIYIQTLIIYTYAWLDSPPPHFLLSTVSVCVMLGRKISCNLCTYSAAAAGSLRAFLCICVRALGYLL